MGGREGSSHGPRWPGAEIEGARLVGREGESAMGIRRRWWLAGLGALGAAVALISVGIWYGSVRSRPVPSAGATRPASTEFQPMGARPAEAPMPVTRPDAGAAPVAEPVARESRTARRSPSPRVTRSPPSGSKRPVLRRERPLSRRPRRPTDNSDFFVLPPEGTP